MAGLDPMLRMRQEVIGQPIVTSVIDKHSAPNTHWLAASGRTTPFAGADALSTSS
jgi:hypothetical protein